MANAKSELNNRVTQAIKEAMAAPFEPSRPSGCGRAYVIVSADRSVVNAVSAACKAAGLMFLRKAYGTSGNAIYMGYDNANGRALGKAKAFAESLNASGIQCYDDAVGD